MQWVHQSFTPSWGHMKTSACKFLSQCSLGGQGELGLEISLVLSLKNILLVWIGLKFE